MEPLSLLAGRQVVDTWALVLPFSIILYQDVIFTVFLSFPPTTLALYALLLQVSLRTL